MNSSESTHRRVSRIIDAGTPCQPFTMGAIGARSTSGGAPPDPETLRQQALKAAYQAGLVEGQKRTLAAVQAHEEATGRTQAQAWARRLRSFELELERLQGELGDRLLDLCARLGAAVACSRIAVDPQAIGPVLDAALATIGDEFRDLTIHASPEDVEAVRAHLTPRLGGHRLKLQADPAIARGGCLLKVDDTRLDARLETRIGRMLSGLGLDPDRAPYRPLDAPLDAQRDAPAGEPVAVPADDATGGHGAAPEPRA